jgi:hypothetical protein
MFYCCCGKLIDIICLLYVVLATYVVKVRKAYTNLVEETEGSVPCMGCTIEGNVHIKMIRK